MSLYTELKRRNVVRIAISYSAIQFKVDFDRILGET